MEFIQIGMRTILFDRHCALGAKMVDFAGWEMPIHYKGIISEHVAVRENVGLFDVSHMGRILIKGPDAERFLDFLSTNKILGKAIGTVTYTLWSNSEGGCVDDVLIYRENKEQFFVIVNAINRDQDLKHLIQHGQFYDVTIQDFFDTEGILSLQGPKSNALIKEIFPESENLKKMHFLSTSYRGNSIILSATGYTGAEGFEIYAPQEAITQLWDEFLIKGQAYQLEPVGLGARDTLRLEMGYALYGHEISDRIAANESVAAWAVKWDKQFLGKEALEKIEKNKRFAYGILLLDKRIAREHDDVLFEEKKIGHVTSGTYSPSLGQAIAMVLVDKSLNEGTLVALRIRQSLIQGKVVSLPFYQKS